MNKKILYIVLIVLGALLLLGLLWWWFLGRTPVQPKYGGSFGSGQDKTQTADRSGEPTNIPSGVPNETAPSPATDQNIATTPGGRATPYVGQIGVPGVTWLSGSTTAGARRGFFSPAGTVFNPTGINSVDSSNPTGGVLPKIGGKKLKGGGGDGTGLLVLAGAALGIGALTCSAIIPSVLALFAEQSAELLTPVAIATAANLAPIFVKVESPGADALLGAIAFKLGANNANVITNQEKDFFSCIARTLAKVAIQQITISVVNWINSGFTGSPSFVTNPTSFFANVADNAAGQFIRGSQLAFLCSPFQLQVKIAIAQSYARNAQSCSLSKVVSNIKGFMNGNFSQGGWSGLISMTADPTNNPYGANIVGTVGLQIAISTAVGQKQIDLLQGKGFLSFTKDTNCKQSATSVTGPGKSSKVIPGSEFASPVPVYENCDTITQTPGTVIEQSIVKTLGQSFDQLGLAKSFDEIISALIRQLMVQALQGGLLGLSGQNGYQSKYMSPEEQAAQAAAQALLTSMQNDAGLSQSYGGLQQGSISDIQNAQSQLNNLANCWTGYASSTLPITQQQLDVAASNALSTKATIIELGVRVDIYNNEITRANSSVATLETLQSRALSAGTTAETTLITNAYSAAKTNGSIITAEDFAVSQQNRTTLQSEMSALNQQTATRLAQCYAFAR